MEKPFSSPRETTSHSRGATATIGFPAARMPYILLGTTTPSRPRLMVMMWASAAARTEETLLAGKKGRNRTLGIFAAAASRRGRRAAAPPLDKPQPSPGSHAAPGSQGAPAPDKPQSPAGTKTK